MKDLEENWHIRKEEATSFGRRVNKMQTCCMRFVFWSKSCYFRGSECIQDTRAF